MNLLRLLPLAFLVFTGCPYAPTFNTGYRSSLPPFGRTPLDAALAVRRFTDARPPREYTANGRLLLTYIPLVPYVSLPYERMDETVRVLSEEIQQAGDTTVDGVELSTAPPFSEYDYPGSVARAVADDLSQQRLFRLVQYVGGAPAPRADYILDGELRATPLTQTATCYGLGPVGAFLWVLPIPIGRASAGMSLSLTLTEPSGTVVWHYDMDQEVSRILTLYNSDESIIYGSTFFSYSMVLPPDDAQVDRLSIFAWHFEALRRGMEAATPSLVAALTQRVQSES